MVESRSVEYIYLIGILICDEFKGAKKVIINIKNQHWIPKRSKCLVMTDNFSVTIPAATV
jgi:hypothetical protein